MLTQMYQHRETSKIINQLLLFIHAHYISIKQSALDLASNNVHHIHNTL